MAEDTAIDEPNWDLFRADLRVSKMAINQPRPSLDFDIPLFIRPRLLGPGDGPPPPRIDLQLVHDSNAFITDKIILPSGLFVERGAPRQRRAYYIVGWPDLPAARIVIDCAKALEYVSPRTLEDWEYQNFLRKEAERDEAKREVRKATAAAANAAASAQAKGKPLVPGSQPISRIKKKKRPGRPLKHQMMRMEGSPPTPQLNSEQEEMLAKRKNGPSLSTPQKSRIAQLDAEMHILQTLGESMDDIEEEAKEKAEASIHRQIEAGLLRGTTPPSLASEVADSDMMDSLQSSPVTSRHQSPGSNSATPSRRGQAGLSSRADPVVQGSVIPLKSSSHLHPANLARSPASLPPQRSVITPFSKPVISSTPIPPPRIPQPSQSNPHSPQTSARRNISPFIERLAVPIQKEAAPSPAAQGYSGFTTTNNFTPVSESFSRPLKRPAEQALPPSSSNGAFHPHKPHNNKERHTKTPKLDHDHFNDDAETSKSVEIHVAAQQPEDKDQEYVVKRLEDDQILDDVHFFQVRWEGVWPEGQNPTWEPEDNIPPNLVKRYFKNKAKKAAQAQEQHKQKQKKIKKPAASHSSASKSAGGSKPPPPAVPDLHKRQSTLEQWARTYSNVSEAFESPAELYDSAVVGTGAARTTTKKANHDKHNNQFANNRVGTHADTNSEMAIIDDENDEADELFIVDSKRSAQELEEAERERKRSLGSQFAAQFGRRTEF